jgi:Secretion system C-terminal sorting domain
LPSNEDPCVTDCVWPGDANGDGVVNVQDIYPIGLNIGHYGKKRQDVTNEWFGHNADNWGKKAVGTAALDLKHADSNGDGLIDSSDVDAIKKNYNAFATVTPSASVQESDVQLQLTSAVNSLRPGDMFEITVSVGSAENPAFDLKGTTFAVGYNANLVQEKSVTASFTKSGWLSRYDGHLMVSKVAERGKLEAGLVKTQNRGSSGHGEVGKVRGVIVTDIVIWRQNDKSTARFTLDDVTVMTGSGQVMKLKGASIEIPLSIGNKNEDIKTEDLFAYPNPTNDVLNFFINGDNTIKTVRLMDVSGREVARLNQVNAKSAILNVSSMANGLYIAEVMTEKGRLVKKVEVMK